MDKVKKGWKSFLGLNGSTVLLAGIAIMILMEIYLQIARPGHGLQFITGSNISGIIRGRVYIGIVACGMTLVMITGNIDLSVGNMMTMIGCIVAQIMMKTDNAGLTVFAAIGIGALCGLLNGFLVSYLKLNSFITTLGTSSIYSALALMISAGTVLVIPNTASRAFQWLGTAQFGPIHILIVWFILVAVILGFILSRTVFGTRLYAIGSNPIAARFSGIRTKFATTIAYVITGACVGLAALVMMANVLSSNPQASSGKEMDIILAVVLGGVAVTGGKGSVWGTIIGVLFTGILSSALTYLNIDSYLQWVVMGVIMVFALSVDALKGRGVKLWKKK